MMLCTMSIIHFNTPLTFADTSFGKAFRVKYPVTDFIARAGQELRQKTIFPVALSGDGFTTASQAFDLFHTLASPNQIKTYENKF